MSHRASLPSSPLLFHMGSHECSFGLYNTDLQNPSTFPSAESETSASFSSFLGLLECSFPDSRLRLLSPSLLSLCLFWFPIFQDSSGCLLVDSCISTLEAGRT